MPDDVKDQVAEQEEEEEEEVKDQDLEEVVEDKDEEEVDDFSSAFDEAADGKASDKEEKEEDEEEEEEAGKSDEEEEEGKAKEEAESEEEVDEDAKAAEERGESIIKDREKRAEEKAEAEREAKEEQARDEAGKAVPLTAEDVEYFSGLVQDAEIPSEVTINGESINLKEYYKDNPEVSVVAGVAAQNILRDLVENGILVTGKAHEETVGKLERKVMGHIFDLNVLRQVSDAYDIVDSDAYKDWKDNVATKNEKALLESPKANDFALALKVFKKYEDSKKTKAEEDKKAKERKEAKKKHDELHSSSLRSKALGGRGTKKVAASKEEADSEFSKAFSEAADKKDE